MSKIKNALAIGAVAIALSAGAARANGNWPNLPLAGGGTPWAASTVYTQDQYVSANGNTYQNSVMSCTSAATGTGPSGNRTYPGILDGTCRWQIISPAYSTTPLTGNEFVPADTNLSQGVAPQSERITTQQMSQFAQTEGFSVVTATNTSGFTATMAQISNPTCAGRVNLLLTGTLGAGAALTMPSLSGFQAACAAGTSWVLRVVNQSSGAFAWTVTGVTNVTVTGTAAVAQNTSQEYLVTVGATAVTVAGIGM
jgi:hypothetical protein